MERLTIEELIYHCDRQMDRLPSGNKFYQEHESVRAYLQILRHYIATRLTPERVAELAQAERDGRLVVLPDWKPGDPPPPGTVIDHDLKGALGLKGATSYCPPNCPNRDCVGGQCLAGRGTKAARKEDPT